MTTKLISANMGVRLLLEKDGKEVMVEWSGVCPSESHKQPRTLIQELCKVLRHEFGEGFDITFDIYRTVEIAKPKKLKPNKKITQEQFNKRVKELGNY